MYRRNRCDEPPTSTIPRKPNEIRVVAGQYSPQLRDATEQVRQVKVLRVYGGFDESTLENDIALIQLTAPLNVNRFVHPIRLPNLNRQFKGWLEIMVVNVHKMSGIFLLKILRISITILHIWIVTKFNKRSKYIAWPVKFAN